MEYEVVHFRLPKKRRMVYGGRQLEYPKDSQVVISFLICSRYNGHMQPVVVAPKNLSTRQYRLKRQ